MLNVRKSEERGANDLGWLRARHSFSFGHYYDPHHMGFRSLRVINEDRIAEGMGFGKHPHKNMEIITYVIEGAVEHEDSMGNKGTIGRAEVQRMSAGSGVYHSEYNPNPNQQTHMLQIWIEPSELDTEPGYEDRSIREEDRLNQFALLASPDRQAGAMWIGADAKLMTSVLESGKSLSYELAEGRAAWVQLVSGQLEVNGEIVNAGDGVSVEDVTGVTIANTGDANAELVFFDLA